MRSWRAPKLGFVRCAWVVGRNHAPRGDAPVGQRTKGARQGERCSCLVSPRMQAEMGGEPICHLHKKVYRAYLDASRSKIAEMRARLDPGPLPVPDYWDF